MNDPLSPHEHLIREAMSGAVAGLAPVASLQAALRRGRVVRLRRRRLAATAGVGMMAGAVLAIPTIGDSLDKLNTTGGLSSYTVGAAGSTSTVTAHREDDGTCLHVSPGNGESCWVSGVPDGSLQDLAAGDQWLSIVGTRGDAKAVRFTFPSDSSEQTVNLTRLRNAAGWRFAFVLHVGRVPDFSLIK